MAQDILTPVKLLLIGGSAGSLDVLLQLLPDIERREFPAIVIVLHRKAGDDSSLAELLRMKTVIPVREAEEKDRIRAGNIYIAPADYHLLIEKDGTFSLDYSEKVNFSRPSIDVSFESAADAFGQAVAAILLSGANDDGSEGLLTIRNAGGKVAVQDPAEASVSYMPQQAILRLNNDVLLLTSATIAGFVNSL